MTVDAENGVPDVQPAGQVSRHAGEDFRDQDRHLVLYTAWNPREWNKFGEIIPNLRRKRTRNVHG
jgi:hypothetical protein